MPCYIYKYLQTGQQTHQFLTLKTAQKRRVLNKFCDSSRSPMEAEAKAVRLPVLIAKQEDYISS
jgi:hypothetical protein